MNTVLAVLLTLAAFAVLMVRPVDAEARTPIEELRAARTYTELRTAARRAGWPRITARTLQVAIVLTLLLLAVVCRMVVDFAYFVGTVVAAIGQGIAELGTDHELAPAGGKA